MFHARAECNVFGTFLVIDVGGGTTDVSVVVADRVDGEMQLEVLAVAGDNELGGVDYDTRICAHLRAEIDRKLAPFGTAVGVREEGALRAEAERVKVTLSAHEEALAMLSIETPEGLQLCEIRVTRATIEELTAPLTARIVRCISRAMGAVPGWKLVYPGPPSYVLLAGQGSKLPAVRHAIESHFARARDHRRISRERRRHRGLQSTAVSSRRAELSGCDRAGFGQSGWQLRDGADRRGIHALSHQGRAHN
jgi:molecular chaperone DnaK (HSP70)